MKALIEIELGNAAFGEHDAEMLYELRCVLERLIDNTDRIRATSVGDFATASDSNGNTVARLEIVDTKGKFFHEESGPNYHMMKGGKNAV